MKNHGPNEFAEMLGVSVKILQRWDNEGKLRGTKKLLRAYKTEINPTEEQKILINKTIGTCRYIYNFCIAHNKEVYESENKFVSGMDFSKWLNKEYLPSHEEFSWIKEVSSKSAKKTIMDAETAFKKFFKKQAEFPRFKNNHPLRKTSDKDTYSRLGKNQRKVIHSS